ncbi:MAG TPA: hypothetical protein VF590_20290 [Isosphaeraceae bacterium]|jgi:hypothetical protein
MTPKHDCWTDPRRQARGPVKEDLAVRLHGHIERKASGRIRDLHVVCAEDMVIVQGRSRTYHAKQLAQEAVLDLMDARSTLANQIVVR